MKSKRTATLLLILYITVSMQTQARILNFQYSQSHLQNEEKIIYLENKYCINTTCNILQNSLKNEIETEEKENKFLNTMKKTSKEVTNLLYLPLLPLSVAIMPIMLVATWGLAFFTINTNDELEILR